MIKLTMGERLKDERINNKLTTQQVCDELKEKYNYKLSVGKLNEMESDVDKDYGYRVFVYLSKLYNVSTDYLLGCTDIKSTDTTMQSVCEYTGLSEEAIQLVVEHKNYQLPEYLVPCVYAPDIVLSFLNRLLSQRAFYWTISDLVNTARHIAICDFLVSDKDKSHAMANLNNMFSEIFRDDFNIDYVVDYEKKKIYEKFQQLIDTMLNNYNAENDDLLKNEIEHFADENYCPF